MLPWLQGLRALVGSTLYLGSKFLGWYLAGDFVFVRTLMFREFIYLDEALVANFVARNVLVQSQFVQKQINFHIG